MLSNSSNYERKRSMSLTDIMKHFELKDVKKRSHFCDEEEKFLDHKQRNFRHAISKIKKKPKAGTPNQRNKKIWFLKHEPHLANSLIEIVTQEFFRLILPSQPKTRLVVDDGDKVIGTVSELMAGFTDYHLLEENLKLVSQYKEKVIQGYKDEVMRGDSGIGELLITAMRVRERDLKDENLGHTPNGKWIKIDGDLGFAPLRATLGVPQDIFVGKYAITVDDIVDPFYPKNYLPYQWLDFLDKGKPMQKPALIFSKELASSPAVRREINRGILKNILLPDTLIVAFVKCYPEFNPYASTHFYTKAMINELLSSGKELYNAAMKNDSFRAYLISDAAIEDLEKYLHYLKTFKIIEKKLLFNFIKEEAPEKTIRDRFKELKTAIAPCSNQKEDLQPLLLEKSSLTSISSAAGSTSSASTTASPPSERVSLTVVSTVAGSTLSTSTTVPEPEKTEISVSISSSFFSTSTTALPPEERGTLLEDSSKKCCCVIL